MSAAVPPSGRDQASDATKGLLIALVTLGHCYPAQLASPWVGEGALYDFHVLAFLLLPFLRPAAAFTWRSLSDRAVRYLVPFIAFALLSAAVWHLTLHPAAGWQALASALWRGDVDALAAGVGFTFLWFMPSLFTLTVLRSAVAATSRPLRWLLGAALVGLHGLVAGAHLALPLNPLPALYALPLGWALAALASWRGGRFLWLAVALACGVVTTRLRHHINVAPLLVPSWWTSQWLALHDLYAVAATLVAVHFGAVLARIPGLVPIGRHSLVIYLSHQFVLKGVELWATRQPWYGAPNAHLAVAAVSVPLALALGWAFAVWLARSPLRPWILPHTVRDWPPLRRVLGASPA